MDELTSNIIELMDCLKQQQCNYSGCQEQATGNAGPYGPMCHKHFWEKFEDEEG